jgi:anti-sigma factor RsiW
MRCSRVNRLVDAYVDGRLAAPQVSALERHVEGCARCRETVALARGINATLASKAPIRAPVGFGDRVMAGVYRQAIAGLPRSAGTAAEVEVEENRGAAYRRLGVSFMLTAGVLALSLLVPRLAYPRLLESAGAEIARGGASVVRGAMTDAGDTVRGALGESIRGGDSR